MKIGIILLIIAIVLIAAFVVLYFVGKRAEKKKSEQDAQLAAAAQTVTMLVIDKKRMPIKDAGFPQAVIDQTPKMMRRSKVPVVKAKVGPRIMSMIADEKIFDDIPVKKEVKATVSGIYITGVRGLRGPIVKPPEKKKGLRARLLRKYDEASKEVHEAEAQKAETKAQKAETKAQKAEAKAHKAEAKTKAQEAREKAKSSKGKK